MLTVQKIVVIIGIISSNTIMCSDMCSNLDMVYQEILELWSFIDLMRASTIEKQDKNPFIMEALKKTLRVYTVIDGYTELCYRNQIPVPIYLYELITEVGKSTFAVLKSNKENEAIAIKVIFTFTLDRLITPGKINGPLSA